MILAKLWHNFTAAPHRVMFFGGALQTIAVMVWWLSELVTRYGVAGHPFVWPIAPGAAHAYLMIYGLFPFFMFGFSMTIFPRWMKGREIPAQYYVPAFMLLMLGAIGFYAGLFIGDTILLSALSCTLLGWGCTVCVVACTARHAARRQATPCHHIRRTQHGLVRAVGLLHLVTR